MQTGRDQDLCRPRRRLGAGHAPRAETPSPPGAPPAALRSAAVPEPAPAEEFWGADATSRRKEKRDGNLAALPRAVSVNKVQASRMRADSRPVGRSVTGLCHPNDKVSHLPLPFLLLLLLFLLFSSCSPGDCTLGPLSFNPSFLLLFYILRQCLTNMPRLGCNLGSSCLSLTIHSSSSCLGCPHDHLLSTRRDPRGLQTRPGPLSSTP